MIAHGGRLDAARARWGGPRERWLDLSTGINPEPYLAVIDPSDMHRLPDENAHTALIQAARRFWDIPEHAAVLPAPGVSSLIARMPISLGTPDSVQINPHSYGEHAASFCQAGWRVSTRAAPVRVVVNPDNPTGDYWPWAEHKEKLLILDESFCDTHPERSHIAKLREGMIIYKGIGKFWGLAGLRLGFAIGDCNLVTQLAQSLGPWPVSGPALSIGTQVLNDRSWAASTRKRLVRDAARMDKIMRRAGAEAMGHCPLFRTYRVDDAAAWHNRLAQAQILTRTFDNAPNWLRLGLPTGAGWSRLEAAL